MLCQRVGTMCQMADYKKGTGTTLIQSCEDKRRNAANESENMSLLVLVFQRAAEGRKKEIYLRQKPGIVTFNAFQNINEY